MTYHLGRGSLAELKGVHPNLSAVVHRSIKITEVDFSVHDGIRTLLEQEEYVARGVSTTMQSKHLTQGDGYGHAVDLVPYINGRLRWEWPPIYKIAEAVRRAAEELEVPIRWGGCWDRLDGDTRSPELMVEEYVSRRRRQGRRAFLDGPHYELLM